MPPLELLPAPEAVASAAETAARATVVALSSAAKIAKAVVEGPRTHSDVATAVALHEQAENEPVFSGVRVSQESLVLPHTDNTRSLKEDRICIHVQDM